MVLTWVAWLLFVLVAGAIGLFCYSIVKYYTDKHESEKLTTFVTVISLMVTLVLLMLIPVDIFAVSQTRDSDGNQRMSDSAIDDQSHSVKIMYYIVLCVIAVFCFVVIPFAYFFYEEMDEDVTNMQRAGGACRYVGFLVFAMLLIFVIGLFLNNPPEDESSKSEWKNTLFDSSNKGDSSIALIVAVMTLFGFLSWIVYTAYGLSAFPLGLLVGKKNVKDEGSNVDNDLNLAREQTRVIEAKYMSGKKMSKKDKKRLELLKRQERLLDRRQQQITYQRESKLQKFLRALAPFRVVFGVVFLIISVLFFISLLITTIDRQANSICGSSCGYVINEPKYFNPFDELMVQFHKAFPLDYIFLILVVGFVLMATISGIVRIGVRFFWVHLYSIRARNTVPQGLLFLCILSMLSLLALNVVMMSVAPRYTTFGSQEYKNEKNETVPCSLQAVNAQNETICEMSQIAVLTNRISVKMPFFGTIFFWCNWASIAFTLLGICVVVIKGKTSNLSGEDSDEDEDPFA
eukprot:GCRY01000990.1.p1 GENE.GCRY01000990.1~~GCRY01000990.1.p1  ORF type:complete len:517 (-),score=105.51 GCRY01000990.1:486-2036(-)